MSQLRNRLPKPGDSKDNENENTYHEDPASTKKRIVPWTLAVLTVLLGLYISMTSSPIDAVPVIQNHPLPQLIGVMSPNTKLTNTSKLGDGKIVGPESIEVDGSGNIYTGLADGRVVKIVGRTGDIVDLFQTGENLEECGRDYSTEEMCGRPLGKDIFLITVTDFPLP